MKNEIKKIFIAHDIEWDIDYEELKNYVAEDNPDMSEDDIIRNTDDIHNDPDKLAEYIECPTEVIIPDYDLEHYIDKGMTEGDAIVEYLSDTYDFCVINSLYTTYVKEQ